MREDSTPVLHVGLQWYVVINSPFRPVSSVPLIIVSNGSTILVSCLSDSVIHTDHKPLLRNVMVTPSLVRILTYVRQFTSDNNVSIEFDPLEHSVKDLTTREELIRCKSVGDL